MNNSSPAPPGENLEDMIKDHLQAISQNLSSSKDGLVSNSDEIRRNITNQGTVSREMLDIIKKCNTGGSNLG